MLRRFIRRHVRPGADRSLALPLVFGSLAVALATVGWWIELRPDRLAPLVVLVGRVLRSFAPYPDDLRLGNIFIVTGAAFGLLTSFTGAILLAVAFLGEAWTKLATRGWRSGHCVVVGDTALANRLALALEDTGARVVHAVQHGAPKTAETGPPRVHVAMRAAFLADALALRRADLVVVDLGDDTATLALGAGLLAVFDGVAKGLDRPGRRRQPRLLALEAGDTALVDQFFDMLAADRARRPQAPNDPLPRLRPVVLDRNRALARDTLARHPLFALAARRRSAEPADGTRHIGVHAVIVGFGDLGEKLLDQILLTSPVGGQASPRVTVVDRDADVLARRFRARRPNVLDALAIEFLSVDLGADPLTEPDAHAGVKALLDLDRRHGTTAIFLTLPGDRDTVAAAMLLRRHAALTGELDAPIFYRYRAAGTTGLLPATDDPAETAPYVPMVLDDAALLRAIRDPRRDRLARALHDAYVLGPSQSAAGARPWDQLDESRRRANLRAVDHLPAKLWTLGLDIAGLAPDNLPAIPDELRQRLGLCTGHPLTPAQREAILPLARLEHERWCIERRLDGYVQGAPGAKGRTHPRLVPWDELTAHPEEMQKDIDAARANLEFVARLDALDK